MALDGTLSKLPSTNNQKEIDLDIRVSMEKFRGSLADSTRSVEPGWLYGTLRQLTGMIVRGWPDTLRKVLPAIRDELSTEDGVILK